MTSPFFRFDDIQKEKVISPLFSLSENDHTRSEKTAFKLPNSSEPLESTSIPLSKKVKVQKKNVLSSIFRSDDAPVAEKDASNQSKSYSTFGSFTHIERKVGRQNGFDSSTASPKPHYGLEYLRKAAGRKTALVKIEAAGSLLVWFLLLIPIAVTLIVYYIHLIDRYSMFLSDPVSLSLPYNNSVIITSHSISEYNGFVRSCFSIDADGYRENLPSVIVKGVILFEANPTVKYAFPDFEMILPSNSVSNDFHYQRLENLSSSDELIFPLPLVDLEHSIGRPMYSSWRVEYNFTLNSENVARSSIVPITIKLSTQTFSHWYSMCSALESIIVFTITVSLLAIFTKNVFYHARCSYEDIAHKLPSHYRSDLSLIHFILPEQFGCFAALLWLSLSCNVSRALSFLFSLESVNIHTSDFLQSSLSASSYYAILCVCLCYIAGLSNNSNTFEEKLVLHRVKDAVISEMESSSSSSLIASPSGLNRGLVNEAIISSIHRVYLLQHHPCSIQFLDFLLPKLLPLLPTYVAVLSFYSIVFGNLWSDYSYGHYVAQYRPNLIALSSWIMCGVTMLWFISICTTFVKTGETLRSTRYLASRLRQVSYRILYFQITCALLVVLCFASYCIYSVVSDKNIIISVELHKSLGLTAFLCGNWLRYLGWIHATVPHSSLVLQPSEGFVFLAMMIISMSVSFMPSFGAREGGQHNNSGGKEAMSGFFTFRKYLGKERKQTPRQVRHSDSSSSSSSSSSLVAVGESRHRSKPAGFCLELACFLLEASYQAYFEASSVKAQRTSGRLNGSPSRGARAREASSNGPKLDLWRIGLELRGVFSCPSFHTFGYLSESGPDIVVAFRGSTLSNIATDFKFTLMALPALRRQEDFFYLLLEKHGISAESILREANFDAKATSTMTAEQEEKEEKFYRMDADTREDVPLMPKEKANTSRNGVKAFMESVPLINQSYERVHVGFWEAYFSIRDQYMAEIVLALYRRLKRYYDSCPQQRGSPSTPTPTQRTLQEYQHDSQCGILFTGHSLGGSMAVLAALELAENLEVILKVLDSLLSKPADRDIELSLEPSQRSSARDEFSVDLTLYCFGCPRLGNAIFAKRVEELIPTCYRVQVDGDLVTMVPKFLGFYRHVGSAVLIDDSASGSIIIDPSVLDTSLFRRTYGTISNHSLEKYRECLEACFEPDELYEYLSKEYQMLSSLDSTRRMLDPAPAWLFPSGQGNSSYG